MGAILCFGEILLRMAPPGRQLLRHAARLDVHVGGAEANVAVALATLGHPVRAATVLPANALGDAALDFLRAHGVDTGAVRRGEGRMGLYFLSQGAGLRASEILYDREASAFALAGPDDFDWSTMLDGVELLHISGITPALGPRSCDLAVAAAEAASRRGIAISFDGNFRARLWASWAGDPQPILHRLFGMASILFGNHRDLSLVLGRDLAGDGADRRRAAAEAAFEAFPRLELIASTAREIDDAETHRVAARVDRREASAQTEALVIGGIVDRIGTGDAFAAGVLHALRQDDDLDTIARTGLALAALKHSLPGDASPLGLDHLTPFLRKEYDVRR